MATEAPLPKPVPLSAQPDSAVTQMAAAKQARRDLRNRFKISLSIVLLLAGVTIRYVVNRFPGVFEGGLADILKDIGGLLVGTVAVTFIYERLIKGEENDLFMEDLKDVLRESRQQDKQIFLADLRGLLHAERQDSGVVVFHERPSVSDKVKVIQTAGTEVIEAGTALRTFVMYLTHTADDQYRDYFMALLQRGVHYKCLMLNPEHAQYTHPQEPGLKSRIEEARDALCRMQAGLAADPKITGRLDLLTYAHMPYFAALCVDGASEHGQMFVTPYLYGVKNANAPAYLISRRDHPDLFEKYWTSLQNQIHGATPVNCRPTGP